MNGLHVILVHKKGYTKSHALFMTPFGAMKNKVVSEKEYNAAIDANDTKSNFKNAVLLNQKQVEYDTIRQQIIEQS